MSVHNEQRFLREALDSLLAQTFIDFQLVIIDDGSTDQTPTILDEYRQKDSRLQIETQENRGLIWSLNRGVQLATSPLIARMDGDDVAHPRRLERQVTFMDEHPNVAVLGTGVVHIDASGNRQTIAPPPTDDTAIRSMLQETCCITHPTVMMRRDAVQNVGAYRKAFLHAEDYDLWLRLAHNYQLANLAEPLLDRRLHEGQVSLKNLRQQVLSTIAARTVGENCGDELAVPTRDVLYDLGVDDQTINRTFVRHYLVQCHDALQRGKPDLAGKLLDDLAKELGDEDAAVYFTAEVWWIRARHALANHRPGRSAYAALRMVAADPLSVCRAAAQRMRTAPK
jgi:glycosyltransferase involved in cell wall biosynthesis